MQEGSQAPKEPAPLGVPEGLWEIFISKMSRKLLKGSGELPGIKQRRAQDPAEKPQQETKNKEANNKKKKQKQVKPTELHHKKSITEEYISFLEDYQQKEIALITLGDYFPDEVKELLAQLDESQDKKPLVEICRDITVYEEEARDDENDDDDEEDDEFELYFSDGNDSLHK